MTEKPVTDESYQEQAIKNRYRQQYIFFPKGKLLLISCRKQTVN